MKKINMLKSLLLQLEEYKTEKDVDGIEAIIKDIEERKELFDYIYKLQNDSIVATNTTTGEKREGYIKRSNILLEIIGCITSIEGI